MPILGEFSYATSDLLEKMGICHCGATFSLSFVILQHININNMIHNNFHGCTYGNVMILKR